MNREIPKSFKDLIGKQWMMEGSLFGNKEIPPTKFTVLGLRWGSGVIMNIETLKEKHPTIELLVKNNDMSRSRWTRGFPVTEIELLK